MRGGEGDGGGEGGPARGSLDPALDRAAREVIPGGRLVGAAALAGGASAGMIRLDVEAPGGELERLVLRQPAAGALAARRRAAREEHDLLLALAAQGVAAPRPRRIDLSGDILPGPWLALDFIDGAPLFDPPDPLALATGLAEALAAIHAVALPALGWARRRGPPEGLWGSGALPGPLPPGDPWGEGAIRAALAGRAPAADPLALVHGDLWPGNALWRGDQLVAVIDWEDAHLGDPAEDLAITRLDLRWMYGPAAQEAFTARYRALAGAGALGRGTQPVWDLVAALRLARLIGGDAGGWLRDLATLGLGGISEAALAGRYRAFVSAALEALG